MEFVNKDTQRRTWPSLQDADGRTLALDPGESAELDLPKDWADSYLQPKDPKRKTTAQRKKRETTEAKEAAVTEAAEAAENPKTEESQP